MPLRHDGPGFAGGSLMRVGRGVAALAVVTLGACTDTPDRAVERPNILWITSEDNGPFLGAYGDSLADTPHLDRLAERGTLYENAFATTPVCAPARFTLITGVYATTAGTEPMRSRHSIPGTIRFFPEYLREAGYHTTNNRKKDYNTVDRPEAWVESSETASYRTRDPGQPFFHVRNFTVTHESSLHDPLDTLIHDPAAMRIPPYHPPTETIKTDWAHYYDQVTKLDAMVGEVLDDLEAAGESENTIVFYFSDHGGVLGRSKRFMFESGLHVPLIVYVPPKYRDLAPSAARTDRLVSFIDFPKTVLSLAGIEPPDYMQGSAFLGAYQDPPRDHAYAYRGRMDERFDLVRTVRDAEYLYVRNFMPHRIYGQHLDYLWRAPSMRSWYEELLTGRLNEVQRRFFETKPAEELYHVPSDPHNVRNLADDPGHQEALARLRRAGADWRRAVRDLGFIPEETIDERRGSQSLYEAAREPAFLLEDIISTAELATRDAGDHLDVLADRLDHPDCAVRFWAATGFSVADTQPAGMRPALREHADDTCPAARTAIAEALYRYGDHETALSLLEQALHDDRLFVVLRALNTIASLDIDSLPASIADRLRQLERSTWEQPGNTDYVPHAASAIIDR
jgi:N-sulfoglucosamine sulfohydrolase